MEKDYLDEGQGGAALWWLSQALRPQKGSPQRRLVGNVGKAQLPRSFFLFFLLF